MTFSILHPAKMCSLTFLDGTTAIVVIKVERKYFTKESIIVSLCLGAKCQRQGL